jgi:uncharacterized protein YeaO (DUF488 family)
MADKWEKFKIAYHTELKNSPAVDELLNDIKEHKTVTLLFAAKDEEHNHALVLQDFIRKAS